MILKLLFATRVADETAYAQFPAFIASKKKKKTVRNSERIYSVDGRRFKRQNRKKIGLISKIARRQWKETMFRLRSWLLLHVKQYKKSCWRTFVIKKCTYLHSASQWSWWRSFVYLPTDLSPTKEIVSTN